MRNKIAMSAAVIAALSASLLLSSCGDSADDAAECTTIGKVLRAPNQEDFTESAKDKLSSVRVDQKTVTFNDIFLRYSSGNNFDLTVGALTNKQGHDDCLFIGGTQVLNKENILEKAKIGNFLVATTITYSESEGDPASDFGLLRFSTDAIRSIYIISDATVCQSLGRQVQNKLISNYSGPDNYIKKAYEMYKAKSLNKSTSEHERIDLSKLEKMSYGDASGYTLSDIEFNNQKKCYYARPVMAIDVSAGLFAPLNEREPQDDIWDLAPIPPDIKIELPSSLNDYIGNKLIGRGSFRANRIVVGVNHGEVQSVNRAIAAGECLIVENNPMYKK